MTLPQAGSLKIIDLSGKVGYYFYVEHFTYLQVSMPTSVSRVAFWGIIRGLPSDINIC